MRGIYSFGFAVFLAVVTSAAAPVGSPTVSPTPLASREAIANPNTTPAPAQAQQGVVMFDVKKLAATTRPAVALVTVLDKSGKPLKLHKGDRVFVEEGRVHNKRPPSPVDWQKVTSMNGYTGWINADYIAANR